MIKTTYNGWDSTIRSKRGTKFYSLLKAGKIPAATSCEVCGSTQGLTFHAEEYGSTWEDYLACCHPLCCYCHGIIHVRARFPNRWKRYVHRVSQGIVPHFSYSSLSKVYGVFRSVPDLPEYTLPDNLQPHWLNKLSIYPVEAEKVALYQCSDGTLIPDPLIYPKGIQSLEGLRYDAQLQELIPYKWAAT